jgi:hypothetical protein
MDERMTRIKHLIEIKEQTDAELETLIGGGTYERKKARCGVCGVEGHTARTCPQKEAPL